MHNNNINYYNLKLLSIEQLIGVAMDLSILCEMIECTLKLFSYIKSASLFYQ